MTKRDIIIKSFKMLTINVENFLDELDKEMSNLKDKEQWQKFKDIAEKLYSVNETAKYYGFTIKRKIKNSKSVKVINERSE